MDISVQHARRHLPLCAAALWLAHPAAALAQPLSAAEAGALRAEIATLKAQIDRLETRLDAATPAAATPSAAATPPAAPLHTAPVATAHGATPSAPATIDWKSAPRLAQGDWWFEPIGRLQYDAAYVGHPRDVRDRGLGFSNEARRIRLGGEGGSPGGFGYKLEVELSDNSVDLVDASVTYADGGLKMTVGNHNGFQSLDELIGDTSGSVMERAAYTDAFGFERRLGVSAQYERGAWLAQGGMFTDSIGSLTDAGDGPDGGDENNSYGIDGRLVFAPELAGWQLHLAGSAHWRDYNRLAEAPVRIGQRPYAHTTNTRLLATPDIAARGETHGGLELAGVRGRLHFASEVHWLTLDRIDGRNPTFRGQYAEVGYYLTPGDSRPYRDGIFQRPTPARPVGEGGIGSVQLTVRYDGLNLDDGDVRGGRQDGYIGALIWSPVAYLRFNLNYARLAYRNPAIAVDPPRDYAIDVVAARVEFDY